MDYQEAIEIIQKENCGCPEFPPDGMPQKCHDGCLYGEDKCAYSAAIYAMQELQQYKQIGTLDEARDALEKQKAKKPKNVGTEGYRYTDTYRCPTCGGNFSGTGIANYCYHCGQRLNWE